MRVPCEETNERALVWDTVGRQMFFHLTNTGLIAGEYTFKLATHNANKDTVGIQS